MARQVGGQSHAIALQLECVGSVASLRSLLSELYAEVTGEELVPASLSIEYEDESGEGFCKLEDNGAVRQGRLRAARSLRVAARPLAR